MKRMFRKYNIPKPVLLIVVLLFTVFSRTGSKVSLLAVATCLLMASTFITKYMVRVSLSFYCMVLL